MGGGHHTDESLPITSQVVATSVVRLNEGIRLYLQLDRKAKIIVSGYHGLHDPTEHAVMQKRLAISLGVHAKDIILHLGTRDTQEEAKAGKKLLGDKPFILVTSASHMTRALKFFTHEGLHPIPAPTNHLGSIHNLSYTNFFSSSSLRKSRIAFHELIGLVWQK
ncbi:MAG: ElyC/SanA/YdcF family protein [Sulfurovum sp.]|nr:ElyC/SanA/YdcF family protein [Sulfurovum sp.]